jgi:hypothetical protein
LPLLFTIPSDVVDIRIPGLRKQPDSAWRPENRPHLQLPNPYVALFPTQTNGDPFPTNSQSLPKLLEIRDKTLSWKTGINVFVLISYNRNVTGATDTWFMKFEILFRNFEDSSSNFPQIDSRRLFTFDISGSITPNWRNWLSSTTDWRECYIGRDFIPTKLLKYLLDRFVQSNIHLNLQTKALQHRRQQKKQTIQPNRLPNSRTIQAHVVLSVGLVARLAAAFFCLRCAWSPVDADIALGSILPTIV